LKRTSQRIKKENAIASISMKREDRGSEEAKVLAQMCFRREGKKNRPVGAKRLY